MQAENEQFKKVTDEKEEMILELSNKRKWLVERCQEKDIQTEKLYKTIDTLHKVIKDKELSTPQTDNALYIQLETQIKNTTETQKTNEKLTLTLNEKEIDIKFLRKELVKLENKYAEVFTELIERKNYIMALRLNTARQTRTPERTIDLDVVQKLQRPEKEKIKQEPTIVTEDPKPLKRLKVLKEAESASEDKLSEMKKNNNVNERGMAKISKTVQKIDIKRAQIPCFYGKIGEQINNRFFLLEHRFKTEKLEGTDRTDLQ